MECFCNLLLFEKLYFMVYVVAWHLTHVHIYQQLSIDRFYSENYCFSVFLFPTRLAKKLITISFITKRCNSRKTVLSSVHVVVQLL